MGKAWVLVVKGNLRHRLDLLGVEKPFEELSNAQRELRLAARQQEACWPRPSCGAVPKGDVAAGVGQSVGLHPDRPAWANGACVYLTPLHASLIQEKILERGLHLQSKHIIVSESFKCFVREALGAKCSGHDREAFLKRRAGAIETEDFIEMSSDCDDGSPHVRSDETSTGCLPSCRSPSRIAATCNSHVVLEGDSSRVSSCVGGIPSRVAPPWGERELGFSDSESAPSCTRDCALSQISHHRSESSGDTDTISERSTRAASESSNGSNPHQRTAAEIKSMLAPVAEGPSKAVQLLTLSADIMERREFDLELLEYLTLPISVQELSPEMWLEAWKQACGENAEWLEMRPLPRSSVAWPFCKRCSCEVDIAHLLVCVRDREITVGPLLDAIMAAEKERRVRNIPIEERFISIAVTEDLAVPSGVCARPGCGLPIGGRGSTTHCCKRCQRAHEAGVEKLDEDPETREPWRKAHGPECTEKWARQDGKKRACSYNKVAESHTRESEPEATSVCRGSQDQQMSQDRAQLVAGLVAIPFPRWCPP